MGKGTELWDDSALINAFDHAMTTYKEMHSNGSHGNSGKEEKHTSDRKEQDLVLVEKDARHVEPADNISNISGNTLDTYVTYDNTEVTTEDPSNQENSFGTDVHAPKSDPCSSGFPFADGKTYCYADQQSMGYSKLLKQYYELEDQKQKVVQQLHQANYWNYETLVQNPTCESSQLSGYTTSEHDPQTSCSLCSCHCIAVPLIPTACAICGLSTGGYSCPSHMVCCASSPAHEVPGNFSADNGQHSSATVTLSAVDPVNCSKADGNAVKVGVLAVERAINSMTVELSAISNDGEGKRGKDISAGILEGNASQGISSETDLTAVLSAWYMAGFQTGRYLSEQSKRNAS